MALYKEIPGLSWDELIDDWRRHQLEEPGTDDGYLDEVALELRERGSDGVDFLRSQLDHADEVRVTAAILGLSCPPLADPTLPDRLLDLVSDSRQMVRASAIRGLDQSGRGDALPQVVQRLKDPSPYVRCAALEFVRRHDPERSREVLLSALTDSAYLVRMCAADELDELDDPTVAPYLQPLLADPHPDVRQAAETAIENLTSPAGSAD